MLFPLFPRYRFTHPKTEQSIFVGRWSYLWAGLLGFIYVIYKGMGSRALLAFAVNISFAILALAITAITILRFVPTNTQALILVGSVPTIVAVQGTMMVNIIRDGYRKRGWKVRQNET